MISLDEKTVRASFVNATRKELTEMTLPDEFDGISWDKLDYLGWRDHRLARRAYIVVPVDGELIGLVLKQAEASPRSRAQCSWCQDVTLPNDVVLYSARRGGAAGRIGNTVGALVCANFQCSSNVRKLPPMAYIGFDVDAARDKRITALQLHVATFALDLMG